MSSDYFFLEEAYRAADIATRDNTTRGARPQKGPSKKQQMILNHAARTKTKVRFLSQGMKRQEENTSMYLQKFKTISWTIGWEFPECDVKRIDHRVRDATTLRDALRKHLDETPNNAIQRHEIKPICEKGIDNVLVYMKRVDVPANQTVYYALDTSATISSLLAGKVIIEYPTFIVRITPPLEGIRVVEKQEEESDGSDSSSDSDEDSSGEAGAGADELEEGEVAMGEMVETSEALSSMPAAPVDLQSISQALVQDLGHVVEDSSG
ncbi:hypothetical protein HDV00_011437 [Rhizophlyctis rosea]|nr:hypothetical protein HDV00_011437 [Rhizophlyctis rosea]